MVLRPRRPEADPIRADVRAGLHGLPCPRGGNAFAHLEALDPSRKMHGWPLIVGTFRLLSARERRSIIRLRRKRRGLMADPREIFRDESYTQFRGGSDGKVW
jgi:hypothetical protein